MNEWLMIGLSFGMLFLDLFIITFGEASILNIILTFSLLILSIVFSRRGFKKLGERDGLAVKQS